MFYKFLFPIPSSSISVVLLCFLGIQVPNSFAQFEAPDLLFKMATGQVTNCERPKKLGGQAYQEKIVQEVYNRLVRAKADFRYPVPALVYDEQVDCIAWMSFKNQKIGLETLAYRSCQRLGKDSLNALAFLLAHELAHYYEKHYWARRFSWQYSDLAVSGILKTMDEDLLHETQADFMGILLAFSAGFDVFQQGPALLADCYASYCLPEEANSTYPSLADRMAIGSRTAELARQWSQLLVMANNLSAIGAYREASLVYRMVLKEFQTRELYNNLGYALVMDALSYFSAQEQPFILPLELDTKRLMGTGKSATSDRIAKRDSLLNQALEHFRYAVSLDPGYSTGFLNMAAVYFLKGDFQRAHYFTTVEARSSQMESNPVYRDSRILEAFIEIKSGNTQKGKEILQFLARNDVPLAQENLDILEGRHPAFPESLVASPPEKPFGKSLAVLARSQAGFQTQKLANEATFSIMEDGLSTVCALEYETPEGKSKYYFQEVPATYAEETSRGIRLGATMKEVKEAYPQAFRYISLPSGSLLVYSLSLTHGVIFEFDWSEKLVKWTAFFKG